ncbi:TRM11 family SAM-dependent methyltransferase [Thermocrinis sp.]|uniref:TRM11 family SAM-dependent methyltransferase n=1 Tax=Thermocrinis sp. TaxID=2024383 RepID=UPI003C09674D
MGIELLDEIDWSFRGCQTQYFSHTFHPYPARFIPQIPSTFIKLFTKERETVLDPMCGCGTTLVEALLHNRNAVGNDLNPLAALISKVKTTLIDEEEFRYFNTKLSSASGMEGILKVLRELKEEGQQRLYDFGKVALSASIWSGKDRDVERVFRRRVSFMQREMLAMAKVIKNVPQIGVICGDARRLGVQSGSVDLIITSPPYVNALDYHRMHKKSMLWLDMDFSLFKKNEIGKHSRFSGNRFRLLACYLADMLRCMIEMNRVLKKGKFCVIVIGNSRVEGELIESHKFFARMSEKIGFRHIKTLFREIDKRKKYTSPAIGKINEEYILVLQKVEESPFSADRGSFIVEVVKEEMLKFKDQVSHPKKTAKLETAIEKLPMDINRPLYGGEGGGSHAKKDMVGGGY